MAEEVSVNKLKVPVYSNDINNLSDNEFHSLLEEASRMTSNKLHDKSPILQKLLHEVKVDDDLKTSNKQKSSASSNNRIVLNKKRSDRKRNEEQKYSAASCMAQGGSLQNLSRKFENECRLKNKLQKSDSISSFSVVHDKVCGTETIGSIGRGASNPSQFLTCELEKVKSGNVKSVKQQGHSSHDRNDCCNVDKRCNFSLDEVNSTMKQVPIVNCKSVPSDDLSLPILWNDKIPPKEEEEIEMMEIDRSDDEYVTAFNSPGKIIRDGKANVRGVCNNQCKSNEEEKCSVRQILSTVTDEVDTAIRLPLTTLPEKDTQCLEKCKESLLIPSMNFTDRTSLQDPFSLRDNNRKSLTDDAKRSGVRSPLDINGNPLAMRKPYHMTGFPHYGKKEASDCLSERNLMSGDKQRKTKRTKGAHTLKEMKAGEVSGNIGNLSIDTLVEYINSADKKTKSAAKNMLIETNNKKPTFKNNKVPIQKMKKNEKENNKKNLPEFQFLRRNPNEMIKEDANTSESENSVYDASEKESKNVENSLNKSDLHIGNKKLCDETSNGVDKQLENISDADFPSAGNSETGRNSKTNSCDFLPTLPSDNGAKPPPAEDAEFHVVMKKHRRNRSKIACSMHRNKLSPVQMNAYGEECDFSRFPWSYSRKEEMFLLTGLPLSQCNQRSCIENRRKSTSSMPPSDHSSVDNSDLDSVHSLPVKSTTVKPIIAKTSSSSSSTPRASYADIAKMYTTASLQRSHFVSTLHPTINVAITSVTENMLSPLLLDSVQERKPIETCEISLSTVEDHLDRNKKTLTHSASYPTLAEAVGVVKDDPTMPSKQLDLEIKPSCPPIKMGIDTLACKKVQEEETVMCSSDSDNNASHVMDAEECDVNDRQLTSITIHYKETAVGLENPAEVSVPSNAISRTHDKTGAGSMKNTKKPAHNKLLPPVIIMDNYEPLPNELELTFGFEINEQLLSMTSLVEKNGAECVKSCDTNPDQSKQLVEDVGSFNYSHVVHYITETWDGILKEFEQEHVSSEHPQNKIKYYSGE